jgi:hypothetical protein
MSEVGGSCLVISQPGQGCRVEFSIPLKQRRHWAWIWNADQFSVQMNSVQMNSGRNDRTNQLSQNRDPTRF